MIQETRWIFDMADAPASEVRIDADDVRRLLRLQAPDLAERVILRAAEGWDNIMWKLGDDLAVRIPRRELAAPLILNERTALVRIDPLLTPLGIRTPVTVRAGRPTRQFPWPWSVVPWIPGVRGMERPIAENRAWAPHLAQALVAMHVEAPADFPHNSMRGVPLRDRDERTRERIGAVDPADEVFLPPIRQAWSAGLAVEPSNERVMIHGDLHSGNIVIAADRVAALIDFGDVTAGDPAYDLAVGWMAFDGTGRDAFRAATGERYSDATWVRARAWAASVALILLTESDDRPDFRALGETIAGELGR